MEVVWARGIKQLRMSLVNRLVIPEESKARCLSEQTQTLELGELGLRLSKLTASERPEGCEPQSAGSAFGIPDAEALGWGLTVSVFLSLAQKSPMLRFCESLTSHLFGAIPRGGRVSKEAKEVKGRAGRPTGLTPLLWLR